MNIAVVDDENIYRMQLKKMIPMVAEEYDLAFHTDYFERGQDFIAALDNKRYDVVFMDVFMPEMDGVETAKAMRAKTERMFLIFMTTSSDHYQDAFSLHAFDYVGKPLSLDRLRKVFGEILDHTPGDEAFVKIPNGTIEEKVYLKDIISVTTDGHYLLIQRSEGEALRSRMTSGEFMSLTGADTRFLMINRGIILNTDRIVETSGNEVVTDDGEVYPLALKRSAEILQQIQEIQFRRK